jgi:hypothetical protein
MKKRYLYALLFGIPGFFVSAIASLFVFGGLLGILWIYIFGDNPWPSSIEGTFSTLLISVFLLVWAGSITLGYGIGRKLEKDPVLNKQHVLISAGLAALFILFIVFQQVSVGNIGPKSDGVLCSEYCSSQGFSASGMPSQDSDDRTCSCYDDLGNEALKTPLDGITPDASK